MPLQGNLPFYECPHSVTLAWLISRVCIYKHNLFILIYILRSMKFIHTPDNAHLFYIIVFHVYLYFQHWRNKDIFLSLSSTNSLRPVDAYMCQESNMAFVMIIACRLIGAEPFFNKCWFMIWHILISESMSVYGRYAVGLLSVWVRDCWSALGYDSSIVLMVGFHSVSCRLSISLKSGDSIPNLTRSDPDMNPTGFTVSSATLPVADSWPIHWKFCGFFRFRVGLTGVTGV